MLGIITGTVCPSEAVKQLALRDGAARLKQYEESLEFFVDSGAFDKLIFCDNSNFDAANLGNVKKKAEAKGIELEVLAFQGDVQGVKTHGKGYGEGEIMKYIMNHSKLVNQEEFFVKITGRLKVDNIKKIVQRLETKKVYFNVPNRTRRDMYDTRMYGIPLSCFRRYFMDEYHNVDDEKGVFLEYVYTDVLLKHGIQVENFPRYPRIVGVSGSNGQIYGYTEWKCKIKDVLSKIDFYRVKKRD